MKGSTREGTPCCSIGRGVRELCSVKVLLIPGSVKSSLSSQTCHEVLNKGRYPMLQQREGSQVALLSEGVDDTW